MYTPSPTNFRLHFEENTIGRDFIVGDLHGCFDEFQGMLEYLEFSREFDRMFSCGDLVDRGPKSLDCLHLLDWMPSARGNHEQFMIDYLIHGYTGNYWKQAGGAWATEMTQEAQQELRSYIKEIEPKLPYLITVGEGSSRFNIVHAELTMLPDISDKDLDEIEFDEYMCECMLWGRSIIQGHPAPHSDNLSITYVGHTPLVHPFKVGKQMYLDGGISLKDGKKLFVAEHKAKVIHIYDKNRDSYSQITY